MGFMFITNYLPYSSQTSVQNSNLYTQIDPYFGLAIGAGLLASVIYFWLMKPHHQKSDKKHKLL